MLHPMYRGSPMPARGLRSPAWPWTTFLTTETLGASRRWVLIHAHQRDSTDRAAFCLSSNPESDEGAFDGLTARVLDTTAALEQVLDLIVVKTTGSDGARVAIMVLDHLATDVT